MADELAAQMPGMKPYVPQILQHMDQLAPHLDVLVPQLPYTGTWPSGCCLSDLTDLT